MRAKKVFENLDVLKGKKLSPDQQLQWVIKNKNVDEFVKLIDSGVKLDFNTLEYLIRNSYHEFINKLLDFNLNNIIIPKDKEKINHLKPIFNFPEHLRHYYKGIYAVHMQRGNTHAERGYLYANNTLETAMSTLGVNNCLTLEYQIGDRYFYKELKDFVFTYVEKIDYRTNVESRNFNTWDEMFIYKTNKDGKFQDKLFADMITSHSGLGYEKGLVIIDKDLILDILNKFPHLNYKNAGNNESLTPEQTKIHLDL